MKDASLKIMVKDIKKEYNISLIKTPIDEVENLEPILRSMVNTAMNWRHKDYDCWEIGKQLQGQNHNIPYRTELEVSAGLWHLINTGKV